ncbi:hypothetical protein BH10PSE8_BH10PSE8_00600 [soil metagenome]
MLPMLTLFYVLMHIQSGDDAVNKNLNCLYLITLPQALSKIEEDQVRFFDPIKRPDISRSAAKSDVKISFTPGRVEADYQIILLSTGKIITVRLEVNVRRINFNIYFDLEQLNAITGGNSERLDDYFNKETAEIVIRRLGHSVDGASYSEPRRLTISQEERHYQSPYSFNKSMIRRDLHGESYLCVVAMKTVSSDFIWESTERSFFCFDLMLMLRAMVSECPEIAR